LVLELAKQEEEEEEGEEEEEEGEEVWMRSSVPWISLIAMHQ
jgi:hypothetical protein